MRIVTTFVLAGLLAAATGCKKSQSDGLPPAQAWGGSSDTTNDMVTMGSNAPHAGPATPHAGGDPSNPHAGLGLDPNGAPIDPASANPHEGQPTANVVSEPVDPRTLDKLADGRLALGPFSLVLPKGWAEKPVTSSMRAANFSVPPDAELVVTYFGQNGAGSIQDNVDRWVGQFGQANKDAAKIETAKFAGQEATIVSTSGHYAAPAMMPGQQAVDKSDQELLAAIVASPSGPYYFKLVGSKKTIDANAAAFRGMLSSLALK